jgi:hypothetical protein
MLSNASKYAIIAFLISSIKTIPFAYFFRFYWRVLYYIVLPKVIYNRNGRINTFGITGKNPADLFTWVSYRSYVSPMEIDMYLHKSNSTYFADLDMARTNLVCKVLQKTFYHCYDNVTGEFKSKSIANFPFVPVATVQSTFKQELNVFTPFRIDSRFLAWDKKWVYVISKFVTGSGKSEKVNCISITKYVFKKKGRITIVPEDMFEECGLLNDYVLAENEKNYRLVANLSDTTDLEAICNSIN